MPLPGLRPGVVMVGEGEDAELRDLQLHQVVKLGDVASIVVALLDGTRDAEALLLDASRVLGEELNPMGLVELLQALDRRALLDTPRARMVVSQGLVRADIAALQRLARRNRLLLPYIRGEQEVDEPYELSMAPQSRFSCNSCNRCCSEGHLLGPVTRGERDRILEGFTELEDDAGSDPSNFIPLPSTGPEPLYLLRPRGGFCSFLNEDDGLCRVHSVLGEELKPSVCRMFPYRAIRTPQGWDAGMSLSCPTVASGGGDDAVLEAKRTLSPLRVISRQLFEVPGFVPLTADIKVPFERYKAWEDRAVERIEQAKGDPAIAWVAALTEFQDLVDSERDKATGSPTLEGPTLTSEPPESSDTTGGVDFIPEDGVGRSAEEGLDNADVLLSDLAFWSELLVGLEAASPMALRRFRSGLLRCRFDLGVSPEAAPVLAEQARLEIRRSHTQKFEDSVETLDEETLTMSTDPDIDLPAQSSGPAVQKRFITQALVEKRTFEYGNIDRGLLALTIFLSVLRLDEVPGDELHPQLEDISYLVHHPQLADILDTRASTRRADIDAACHEAILGLR